MIVDLMPTDDQTLIADSVGSLFAAALPVARLRDAANRYGGAERASWSDLAGLGLFGLGVAADQGGIGYTVAEEILVAQLAGLHLVSPTLLATMLAAHGGDPAPYTDGRRVAFAQQRPGGEAQLFDAEEADEFLFLAGDEAILVPASAASGRERVEMIDEMVSIDRAVLDLAAGRSLSGDIVTRADLLLSAYLSGIAKGALDMAVAYAGTREQFGQPIGAFQAIKHSCADMALRVEAAFCQTCYAGALAESGAPGNQPTASARLLAERAALLNGRANIQIHGGMGFTDEADAHLYLKRAHVAAALNGDKNRLRANVLAG